mmetsp:Transcript_138328/g.240518  ORF Transcript_138328/g.240518 Transcript_138328/m.240518 type:complete len:88 (-) Transcript_138328:3812-4075(-)
MNYTRHGVNANRTRHIELLAQREKSHEVSEVEKKRRQSLSLPNTMTGHLYTGGGEGRCVKPLVKGSSVKQDSTKGGAGRANKVNQAG